MITSINWKLQSHMTMRSEGRSLYRDDAIGVQLEAITPRRGECEWGKQKNFYFIDNDPREFLTEDELIDAYNEKFRRDGEDPEHEVKYVKVITKRPTNTTEG